MPVSNSDIAAILRFVHKKGDNFIRTLTVEDNEVPRGPIDLTGHEAIFEISTIKRSVSVFTVNSTDIRSKVVFISATGLLRIGSTTTPADCAYLPVSGLRIRIPNIIISSSSSANFASNLVNATLATRWDMALTNSGSVSMDKFIGAGFNINAVQAYSLSLTNCAMLEQLAFSETGSEVILDNCHIGLPATNLATVGSPIVVITSLMEQQ